MCIEVFVLSAGVFTRKQIPLCHLFSSRLFLCVCFVSPVNRLCLKESEAPVSRVISL